MPSLGYFNGPKNSQLGRIWSHCSLCCLFIFLVLKSHRILSLRDLSHAATATAATVAVAVAVATLFLPSLPLLVLQFNVSPPHRGKPSFLDVFLFLGSLKKKRFHFYPQSFISELKTETKTRPCRCKTAGLSKCGVEDVSSCFDIVSLAPTDLSTMLYGSTYMR